jgi:hypothetical protein
VRALAHPRAQLGGVVEQGLAGRRVGRDVCVVDAELGKLHEQRVARPVLARESAERLSGLVERAPGEGDAQPGTGGAYLLAGELRFVADELVDRHVEVGSDLRQHRHVGQALAGLPLRDRGLRHAQAACQLLLRDARRLAQPRDVLTYVDFWAHGAPSSLLLLLPARMIREGARLA